MAHKAKSVLFLGEGDLSGPARYLAAILQWSGFSFDHVPDQSAIPTTWFTRRYNLFILSDYRHSCFSSKAEQWLCEQVEAGSGLLMVGGWASFTGLVGHYSQSRIEGLLPVTCIPGDDRVNWASGSVMKRVKRGEKGEQMISPPIVCGYHNAQIKPESQVLWELQDLSFKASKPYLGKPHPLLVMGQAGLGKTAAFLTDCAPHWAGGLVDWGPRRIQIKIPKHGIVEVGDQYLQFFKMLINHLILPAKKIVVKKQS